MPLIRTAFVEDLQLEVEKNAFVLGLNLKTFWNTGKTIDDRLERFLANRRRFRCARVFRLKNRCRFSELCFLAGFSFFDGVDFVSRHFQPQCKLRFQRGGVVFAEGARLRAPSAKTTPPR